MPTQKDVEEFSRAHYHYLPSTRRDIWCEDLTHCPSICNCPIDEMAECALPKKKG